jgi:hypothetical protein
MLGSVDMTEHYFNQTEMTILKNYLESGLYVTAASKPDTTVQFAAVDNVSNVWWRPMSRENLEQTAVNTRMEGKKAPAPRRQS